MLEQEKIEELRKKIASIRRVKYGDYVLSDDHNKVVDALKYAASLLEELNKEVKPVGFTSPLLLSQCNDTKTISINVFPSLTLPLHLSVKIETPSITEPLESYNLSDFGLVTPEEVSTSELLSEEKKALQPVLRGVSAVEYRIESPLPVQTIKIALERTVEIEPYPFYPAVPEVFSLRRVAKTITEELPTATLTRDRIESDSSLCRSEKTESEYTVKETDIEKIMSLGTVVEEEEQDAYDILCGYIEGSEIIALGDLMSIRVEGAATVPERKVSEVGLQVFGGKKSSLISVTEGRETYICQN